MKKIVFLSLSNFFIFGLLFCNLSYSQITVTKSNGGRMIVATYGNVTQLNDGSSLNRDWVILNDAKCPLQLGNDIGINTVYNSDTRSFRFGPTGKVTASEGISAYEIHHVLYNVFGEHISTLSNVEINDLNQTKMLKEENTWYGTDNDIVSYLSCVSYVASVRTANGTIWRYNPLLIKQELNKIKIKYEEGYTPSAEQKKE